MSVPSTITTAFTKQYSANLYILSQQLGSKMRDKVRVESITGAEQAAFERLGTVAVQKKETRHGDTPNNEQDHTRRWLTPEDWNTASLLDKSDELRIIIEPTSSFARTQAAALGRKMDDILIEAALGSAAVNKTGSSTIAFKDDAVSINGDGTATTLGTLATAAGAGSVADISLAKMLLMMQLFNDEDVDPDIKKCWMVTPKSISDMLDITEVGSADYNTVKTLTMGKVETFMGFDFFWSNRVTKDAASETAYRSIAWAQDGLILGMPQDISTRISERDDKNYTMQVYAEMSVGALRMEGAKVHECLNKIA